MKLLISLMAAAAALVLAGCEEPAREEVEIAPPPIEAPLAPSAADQGVPATDPNAPMTPSTTPLPADDRSSEQSVQPESETLFY